MVFFILGNHDVLSLSGMLYKMLVEKNKIIRKKKPEEAASRNVEADGDGADAEREYKIDIKDELIEPRCRFFF